MELAAIADEHVRARMDRLEPRLILTRDRRLDRHLAEPRTCRIRVAVHETDDVGAVAARLVGAHEEANTLARSDARTVAVALNALLPERHHEARRSRTRAAKTPCRASS